MPSKNLPAVEDLSFVNDLSDQRLKQLIFVIKDQVYRDIDDHKICKLLGLSMAQLIAIRKHPEYVGSITQDIKVDDGDVMRAILRQKQVKVAETISDMAEEGDKDMIKLFVKIMGADVKKETNATNQTEILLQFIQECGYNPKDIAAAKCVAKSKKKSKDIVYELEEAVKKEKTPDNLIDTSMLDDITPLDDEDPFDYPIGDDDPPESD